MAARDRRGPSRRRGERCDLQVGPTRHPLPDARCRWSASPGSSRGSRSHPFRADVPPLTLRPRRRDRRRRCRARGARGDAAVRNGGACADRDGWRTRSPSSGRRTSSSGGKRARRPIARWSAARWRRRCGRCATRRFDGDVVDRAEEWRVTVGERSQRPQIVHALPEARPGAHLTRRRHSTSRDARAEDAIRRRSRRAAAASPPTSSSALRAPTGRSSSADPRVECRQGWRGALRRSRSAGDGRRRPRVASCSSPKPGCAPRASATTASRSWRIAGAGIFAGRGTRGADRRRAQLGPASRRYARTALGHGRHLRADRAGPWRNGWPVVAMQLSTTDPVAVAAGGEDCSRVVASALAVALLAGLLRGRRGVRRSRGAGTSAHRPAGRRRWGAGVGRCAASSGLQTALGALGARDRRCGPWRLGVAVLALGRRAMLSGLDFVMVASGGAVRRLRGARSLTRSWTRRLWLAVAVVVALESATALALAAHRSGRRPCSPADRRRRRVSGAGAAGSCASTSGWCPAFAATVTCSCRDATKATSSRVFR